MSKKRKQPKRRTVTLYVRVATETKRRLEEHCYLTDQSQAKTVDFALVKLLDALDERER